VPSSTDNKESYQQYRYLLQLERELFRWWCTFLFRPESGSGAAGLLGGLLGNNNSNNSVSPELQGFIDCLERVNDALTKTKGPYFLGDFAPDHPTMIDFVFASHVERMLASVAYWKGYNLRSRTQFPQLEALQGWIDALETHEYYLAFKSDYYTHVKDIPPQYGPGYDGIANLERIAEYQSNILGRDGNSWNLPLSHDDELQPLYRGPPLPLSVLEAAQLTADADGSYETAGKSENMAKACRSMASWKLASNGPSISIFSARGGPSGANNPRKTFGAQLADPYAESDTTVVDAVDAALRVTGLALQDIEDHYGDALPTSKYTKMLKAAVPKQQTKGVISSLQYLRDRIGVPRDLPLASARYLRAYLNWAIDTLKQ